MKTLLITGAGGFLGRMLLSEISRRPMYKAIALSTNPAKLSQFISDRIKVEHADYINSVYKCEDDIYCIINLAYPRNGKMVYEGLSYIEDVLKTAADSSNVRSVINISSQSIYDPKRRKSATENTQIVLDSTYALGKYATEMLTNNICRSIPHTNIRLASLIGPGFDQRIVNRFIISVFNGDTIQAEISDQSFGFFDVRDAANGLLQLIETPFEKWKETYNLGNGKHYSIKDILDSIIKTAQVKGFVLPEIITTKADKDSCSGVDADLFCLDTGFKPQYSLDDSVSWIFDYMIDRV